MTTVKVCLYCSGLNQPHSEVCGRCGRLTDRSEQYSKRTDPPVIVRPRARTLSPGQIDETWPVRRTGRSNARSLKHRSNAPSIEPEIVSEPRRLLEHGRLIARSILQGSTEPVLGARQLHEEVVAPLGHPASLISWCGLSEGIHVSPHDFSARRVDGDQWAAAIVTRAEQAVDGELADLATVSAEYAAYMRRSRSQIRVLLSWLGGLLQLASIVFLLWLIDGARKDWSIVKFDFVMVLMFGPGTLFFLGQRLRRARLRPAPSGPTAVLLRPFFIDKNGLLIQAGGAGVERGLERALSGKCRLVAIGRPGEILPPLGGHRVYVDVGNNWKSVLALELCRSSLVVMLAGESLGEGAKWELQYVLAQVDPSKFIVLGPFSPAFRKETAAVFPHPLPATPGRVERLLGNDAFISFDSEWRPQIMPTSRLRQHVTALLA